MAALALSRFNSKMVRLKDTTLLVPSRLVRRFNSKMVRLKVAAAYWGQAGKRVSIPKWCD